MSVRVASRALFAWMLVTIGVLTLLPGDPGGSTAPPTCVLACGDRGLADAILNVALFAPLGIALRGLGWRARTAVLFAFALTVAVESAQYVLPGRDAGVSDVIANTVGAALGYAVARGAAAWLVPGRRRSLAASALVLTGWLATGALLRPAVPEGPYYGQWTPRLSPGEAYLGRVRGAAVGPLDVADGRLPHDDSFRVLWRAGRALDVTVIAGPRSESLAPMVRIVTETEREVVLLGADRGDLVLQHWTTGRGWRLDLPAARLRGALRTVDPGDTLQVSARLAGERACVSAGGRSACSLAGTVGAGWSLLYFPGALPQWSYDVLGAVWLLGFAVVIGLWAPSGRCLWTEGAVLVAAVLILPSVTPLHPTRPGEVIALLAGLWIGGAAQAWVRRRLRGAPPA